MRPSPSVTPVSRSCPARRWPDSHLGAHDLIHVPVIDPIVAPVKQAEALVALGTIKASRGSFKRPALKTSSGLSGPLGAYLERAQ
jgi:hypothetical protein